MSNYRIMINQGVTVWMMLLCLLSVIVVSCGDSSSHQAAGGTGTLAIKLRHDSPSLKQFNLVARQSKDVYLNRLLVKFYADDGSHEPGDLMLTRDEAVQPEQETVLLEDIPAPQDYYISVDIFFSDSEQPYNTAYFLASVQPGVTTQATPIATPTPTPTPTPTQVDLEIESEDPTVALPVGGSTFCDAYAIYSDGSRELCNDAVTWQISDPSICTLTVKDGRALICAVSQGEAWLTATDDTFTCVREVTVSGKELSFLKLEPDTDVTVQVGEKASFKAIALYTDDSEEDVTGEAVWSVSGDKVAQVDAAGSVVGLAAGECLVSATYNGLTATAKLTVEAKDLIITPATATAFVGESVAFQAIFKGVDVTDRADWSVSGDYAQLEQEGLFTALKPGQCEVTTSYENQNAVASLIIQERTM